MGRESQEIEVYRNDHRFRRENDVLGPVQEVERRLERDRTGKVHPNRSYNRFSLRVHGPLSEGQKELIKKKLRARGYPHVFFTDPRPESVLVLGLMEDPHAPAEELTA